MKVQVIGDYENGKAVPNAQIAGKIERALDVRLPRPAGKEGGGTGEGRRSGRRRGGEEESARGVIEGIENCRRLGLGVAREGGGRRTSFPQED